MNRFAQLITLDLLPRLGVFRLSKILKQQSPFALFSLTNAQLHKMGSTTPQVALILRPPQCQINLASAWLAQDPKRTIISFYDDDYPALLKELSAPPMLLFCNGDTGLLATPQIAIVGSRSASYSGKENAKSLAMALVKKGYTITSGLAVGIDSCAHYGALAAEGKTIAVLGSGLDNIYPKVNLGLAQQIVERGGLIISEFWPDRAPYATNFPRRNRVVSGLSLGVLVVEAEARSGSLITARLAAEQNREVFAVPGAISNPKTAGCHHLINQGAKLITGVADILDELPSLQHEEGAPEHKILHQAVKLSVLGYSVISSIEFEVTSVDQVVLRSNAPVAEVLEQLLELELAGLIASVSGGYIRIKENHDV